MKGQTEKAFLLQMGYRYPGMVNELHTDHRFANRHGQIFISDRELDQLLYGRQSMVG